MANLEASLSPYAKVKVYWDDKPENYSKEASNRIRNYFAKKYGFNKNNIEVIYRPVRVNENGDIIEISGANIENILDVNYQRELMKEWIKREDKQVDFNRIIALDEKVNAELNIENNEIHHKNWSIRWLMIDNFLSFGEKNYLPFNKLKGLTVVNSLPANQGGKTTLTIDALKFLLHGSTTKTDKNEQIFNTYSNKNELVVRGMVEIAGEELIIERKMKRSAKKTGEWTVTNKVNYYEILPDGEEKQLNEEDAKKTTIKLEGVLGLEKDFEMLVLATERNLDDLIGLTTTESGKILTRLIGLEIIEMKEAAVRKMYNEFNGKKKSNDHDVVTLTQDIETHKQNIVTCEQINEELNVRKKKVIKEIKELNADNDKKLTNKIQVDVTITSMNPTKLESEILSAKTAETKLDEKIDKFTTDLKLYDNLKFNEDEHHELTTNKNKLSTSIVIAKSEIKRLENTVQDLIDGGICEACQRPLEGVDNTAHIATHRQRILDLEGKVLVEDAELDITNDSLEILNADKKKIDLKNWMELERDRAEVEKGSLKNTIVAKENDLKKYQLNLDAIEQNRRIDAEVAIIKTKLDVANYSKEDLALKIEKIAQDSKKNTEDIETKEKLIVRIKKEEEIERVFKIYIDLVGKKGISKLVLRSVLPIINSEVQRLLEDVVDFEVEIFIDDKNDVQFLLNKDGVSKLLKSGSGLEKTAASLALRGILGKLSTLPMPNFISFDEVLGKVANENLEKLKPLFDKIKNMYEIVFLITHNDVIKDWGDNIVTVQKENNISKITLK